MGDMDALEWLQRWYLSHCDGNWEHLNGVQVETLDNPGWSVRINLRDTGFSNFSHEQLKLDQGSNDWIMCWIEDETFRGTGDPTKLKKILTIFRKWVEAASSRE